MNITASTIVQGDKNPVTTVITRHPIEENAYVITAIDPTDPNNTHAHVLTLGPVSGGVAIPDQATFQKMFDDARQVAASHVAFRAAIKDMEAQLV